MTFGSGHETATVYEPIDFLQSDCNCLDLCGPQTVLFNASHDELLDCDHHLPHMCDQKNKLITHWCIVLSALTAQPRKSF